MAGLHDGLTLGFDAATAAMRSATYDATTTLRALIAEYQKTVASGAELDAQRAVKFSLNIWPCSASERCRPSIPGRSVHASLC